MAIDGATAKRILRLAWLEKRAQEIHKRAFRERNAARMMRAARLWYAVEGAFCSE
jgi:hypothetical protein